MTRRVSTNERRARLGRRHHLAAEATATDVVQAARSLCGLHATDPATVFLSAWARVHEAEVGAVEAALYEERSLVRMLGMRRTMFVVPRDLAPVVQASSTRALLPGERRRTLELLRGAGVEEADAWLQRAEEAALAALGARGQATTAELSGDVAELGQRVTAAPGTKWAAEIGMASRVLFLLSAAARVVRGRPRGSWVSSQYRWATVESWLGAALDDLDPGEARAELVRRWLAAFGPGTEADLRWWTGWTLGVLRPALAAAGAVPVDLDGVAGHVLEDDLDEVAEPAPWVALLPALDPTPMGWSGRDWYLGEHRGRLFDRSGNVGPTIWCDGRVVGGWAQRGDGEVVTCLLEDIGREAAEAVEGEAGRLTGWFGGTRVTPRFRTPLERELSA